MSISGLEVALTAEEALFWDQLVKIARFGADDPADSDSRPVSPDSNLDPSSHPFPEPTMSDAADVVARLERLERVILALSESVQQNPRAPSPAASLADPALPVSPGLFSDITPATKSVLRPNPPFVFDGDRSQGRAFLHAVRTYARLVPEGFVENGEPSEEKVVRFAMSYMAKDAAQRWAERHSAKAEFPFPTWDQFVAEFRLRFVAENEQDHAMQRLESRAYFMGSRDVFRYTDEFEDLAELAGLDDPLMKVAKFRTGLDLAINHAITSSSDPPDIRDYTAWRTRAYRQYESQLRARAAVAGTRSLPADRHPAAPARGRVLPALPTAAPPPPPRQAVPMLPPPVPMDIDRGRARAAPRRGCFRCGDPAHFARDCPLPADARVVDVLDEVICQLGGDLLEELVARVSTTAALPSHPEAPAEADFPASDE